MTFTRVKYLHMLGSFSNSRNLLVRSVHHNVELLQWFWHQPNRHYAFKSDLKIKWVRPEKISCIKPEKSGDLKPVVNIDLKLFPLEFQKSSELKNADELIKRLFTLEFQPRRKTMEVVKEEMVNRVRRHFLDWGSAESKIACLTGEIRGLQEHMEKFPRDLKTKVLLKELIDNRKKKLKYLRRWDYKRFEWLLEKLDLVFRPPPSHFHWIARKDSLRKLTDLHCENLKQERLTAYKQSLDAQKTDFLRKKVKTLEWIRSEEEACGVESTVSREEIEKVLQQLRELETTKQLPEDDKHGVI